MNTRRLFNSFLMILMITSLLFGNITQARAQDIVLPPPPSHDVNAIKERQARRITNEDRLAAAQRVAENTPPETAAPDSLSSKAPEARTMAATAAAVPAQGGTPNYFGPESNWAQSPMPTVDPNTGIATGGIRKFVDSLPGLGAGGANNLGQYIPVAVADTTTYPGADYYEIQLGQYTEKLHSDLNPTDLRGYRQTNMGGTPFSYLGPLIIASKDRPVRIKFTNSLPTGAGGKLFLPVDTTMMGAGMGPLEMNTTAGYPMNYTENRATLHLHGGLNPWISDGTQNQWITPAGEQTDYPKGVSVVNVPDMPDPGPGSQTFYYTNQQGARLMFYHDHAFGITRLNVYAGEAAGYLLTDSVEQDLITRGILPGVGTPLIIQDKTFIDSNTLLTNDPTWPFPVDATKSNLWLPHVYMPNQNPNDLAGVNALGRWDYGPWFWPPWPVTNQPITLPDGTVIPNVPDLSAPMESYMDTPLVNGTAYPYLNVDPKTYRFRVLNASNDRMWNLQMYVADPTITVGPGLGKEVKMVPAVQGAAAFPPEWTAQTPGQPGDILDGRTGGVPDPALIGPSMIQIGTEGGFLPSPVVLTNVPLGYDRDPKSITIGNVKEHNLWLGPAERADVLVDFSQFAGKTIILYNDSCAACPATDSRLDYYTGDLDNTAIGGTVSTLPGFGPNTRTVMQFRVANTAPAPAYNLPALQAEFASTATTQGVFARGSDPIIVPQGPYNSAYNGNFPVGTTAYSRIQNTSLTFTPLNGTAPVTIPFGAKAIQELFNNDYGRMAAYLGVELPFTNGGNQTTLDFKVQDPVTEILNDAVTVSPVTSATDGTQMWKITHNGVDTHPIHFHLFNVQVINRVGWDGSIRYPDLNELGWKDTVKMNPLEDIIVAMRPVAPKVPFGQPDSIRPLDPTMPIGATAGFRNLDPATGNPIVVTNQLYNFGWEYVWHCHILSHEEMDMMRPIQFNVARALATAPVLSAAGNSGSPINLTWTDATPAATSLGNPANEIGFRIERATGATGGTFAAVGTALANATSFTNTGTTASQTYRYRVVAFNAAGETISNVVTVVPGVTTPAAPSNLVATAFSSTQINLTWTDNATNETGFQLQRSTSPTFPAFGGATTTIALGANLAAYSDTGRTANTTYYYRVRAVNASGNSAYSNTASATTPALPPPAAPTALAATAFSSTQINLAWTDNAANETGFTVQRATSATFTGASTITLNTANLTSYNNTGLAPNTTYYYRVRAFNAAGTSAWSNTASATTPNVTLPAAPTNLVGSAARITGNFLQDRVTLTWTDNANNETGFTIQSATNSTFTTNLTTSTVGANVVTFTQNVSRTQNFYYRIRATNAAGNSAWSNVVFVTTP